MMQVARNVTMDEWGFLDECRYLLHDRDTKYTQSFRRIIGSGGVEPLRLPPRSPNLNAYAERWVKSVKDECLSKLILFGEASLRRALAGISGTLSPGTQSTRQREHTVVPFHDQTCGAG